MTASLRSAAVCVCNPSGAEWVEPPLLGHEEKSKARQKATVQVVKPGSDDARSGFPEESTETFLLEMGIIRKHLGDALVTHRLHRNAVRQAVTLVQTHAVKIQAG